MSVTARPMPRAPARPGAPVRRPARPTPRPEPAPKKASGGDAIRFALIGAGLAVAAVIGIVVIWEFGAARNLAVPHGAIGGGASTGEGPSTTMYRDLHDGRVMVMEVGPNGTRLKGTVSKSTLPIANDADRDTVSASDGRREPSSADRVNALGSAFR